MSSGRVHLLIDVLPFALGLVGVLVVFAQDPLWPAQDMTPQMAVDYHRAQGQAAFGYQIALGIFVFGLLWLVVRRWWRSRARRPTSSIPIA